MKTTKVNTLIFIIIFSYMLLTVGLKVKVVLNDIECKIQNPELIYAHCYINKTLDGNDGMFMEFNFTQDIDNLKGVMQVDFFYNKQWQPYIKYDIDFCTFLQAKHTNYIVKMLAVQLRRIGNFPINCPFKKHYQYYEHGLTVDTKIVPYYMPVIIFRSNASFIFNQRQFALLSVSGSTKRG